MAQSFAGTFELLREIGAGGFGTVYEACDRLAARPAAVKVLHAVSARAESRFAREVSLLSELEHPNIVRYLGHGRTNEDRPYLAMEWLEGTTLADELHKGALSVNDTLAFARCVVAGLEQAQRLGIVHRDLKPANLFLARGNVAETKILDFGLARRIEDAAALTGTDGVVGTPYYMSPEQARGDLRLDFSSDVFALGSVLYECLTGARAFGAASPLAVLMKICVEEPPAIEALRPSLPPTLGTLVHAMLAKAPASRPCLRDISGELERLIAHFRDVSAEQAQAVVLHTAAADAAAQSLSQDVEVRVLAAVCIGHAGSSEAALESALIELQPAYGARGERLRDGSRILLLDGHVAAGEQVLAAARLALALRAIVAAPTVVCTGRALVGRCRPLGDLIESGASLLGEAGSEDILLDEASAALLDARFEIAETASRRTLVRERLGGEAPRTLLGQVTPFVGRERELSRLLGLFDEALEDRAAKVVLVISDAGGGKSRLRYELAQRLRLSAPELRLISAQGDAMRAGTPFSVLSSALHAWAGLQVNDSLAVKQRKLSTRVLRCLVLDRAHIVTPFLGEMIGVPFADESNPALREARSDPHLMSDRLLSSFLEWCEALAAAWPLALLVEDLQWADAPSIRFLDAALSVLAEQPFVLVAFGRPEVRTAFPSLWAERGVLEIRLPKLSAHACRRLLESIGAADVSPSTLQWIVERADGNPFFLEELVRGLRAPSSEHGSLPDTILGIVQTRLDALGEDAKGLVRAASVFGQVFQVAALKALLGDHAERFDVAGLLRMLTEREVLFVRGSGDAREYVFRHGLIRDAAYALHTPEERKLAHRRAAVWLEQYSRAEPALLADHYEFGELPERAAVWYCSAAAAAFEADSLPEVLRCGERAVRCGVGGEALGEVAALVAEALAYQGQQADAAEWAASGKTSAVVGGAAWWRASQVLAIAHLSLGMQQQAAQAIEEMIACATGQMLTERAAIALPMVAGNATMFHLEHYGARILDLLEALPVASLSGRAHGCLHTARAVAAYAFSPKLAIHWVRQAIAQYQRAGSLKDVLHSQGRLGWFLLDAGWQDEAEACLIETNALAKKLGAWSDVATCCENLAVVCFARGQPDLSAQWARQALSVYARLQNPRGESISVVYLARAEAARGGLDEVAQLARKARECAAILPLVHATSLAVSAEIECQRGRFDAGLTFARSAMILLEAHDLSEHVALIRVAFVDALLACGHVDEARASLTEALAWLTTRANTFDDPAWRTVFLTRVPEHARLVQLGERLKLTAPT